MTAGVQRCCSIFPSSAAILDCLADRLVHFGPSSDTSSAVLSSTERRISICGVGHVRELLVVSERSIHFRSNHRDTGRDTGCGQACTLHASNQSLPSAVNPHFSVQPADGLTHLFRRAPARASSWCRCLPGAGMQPACAVFPAGFGVQSGFRASPAPGPCGQTRAGSAWTWPRARSPCLWQPSRSRSGPGTCDGHAVEGLLGFQRRFGKPAALPSIRAPTTNSLISQAPS